MKVQFPIVSFQHPLMAKAKNNGNTKPDSGGIYVNNKEIKLKETISKNNKLYVPLREFCEKLNMKVEWVPIHSLTYGGAKPVGINITNPTFIYTDRINVEINRSVPYLGTLGDNVRQPFF